MLQGLRVWVDETVAPVELTLGLPVMQKLGYTEQTLLKNARRQQAVWDFGDQPITTPGVAMHRTLRMGELSDGIDDDEGWRVQRQNLEIRLNDDGPVRIVLEAKVAEAAAAGMPKAAIEHPQDLLVRLKEGVLPVKSGLRRYPPTHMAFLEKHVYVSPGAVPDVPPNPGAANVAGLP
ncbi:hypothetical protein DYB38_013609 [Aphanomyces astaci]|uniref:Uncharacterized protein n=1 Tax=Aphanomyces astaci TaxID=112090 RepID=A0A397E9L0_APHAT|nr:hypothetical protein DYB38_013609 [Aphanomyces astaci]